MPWTPERQTINQRVQIGAEAITALGTNVPAGKLLECFSFDFAINGDVNTYTPTGHKYPNVQEENSEWVDISVTGNLDYTGACYPLGGVMGAVTAINHLASVTAKDWIFTPPTTGSIVPQTYSLEQGDAVRAHKVNYGLFTDFGYKGTRKDFTCTGKMIAQPITDAITLTATPTPIAISPVVAKQVSVYLDPTQAALGTTQLLRVLSVDYAMGNTYGPLWVLNRTTVGWVAHVDLMPKATIKIKVEADAAGMALLGYLQVGTTYYLRVQAIGPQIASDGPGSINNTFQHDMAIKIGKPSTFADDAGVFAIEWDCPIIEDPTWGKSQVFTLTNLLATL